jgi:valyl-tRNA synthetase
LAARYQRARGKVIFYPMGWDDNGLPTERRVQNYYGVRCDPTLPYDPLHSTSRRWRGHEFGKAADQVPISRRNFVELCEKLTVEDEKKFEELWRTLGLSVDWSQTYRTISDDSQRTAQRAFLRNLARGEAYQADAPTLWDITFRTAVAQAELEDKEVARALTTGFPSTSQTVARSTSKLTRPELIPACVALVANPGDERYKPYFGTTVRTPLFGVEVPVLAHPLAQIDKGSGIAMICTFGDVTDVIWWRELSLPTRPMLGFDGRVMSEAPTRNFVLTNRRRSTPSSPARRSSQHKGRMVEMLTESADLLGDPRPITHPVKFFEKGDKPLEIVTTRQWYITNGAKNEDLRERLIGRGKDIAFHPDFMRVRYENWVGGLNGDWLISRQRFFGVPIPVWYPLDSEGNPVFDSPMFPVRTNCRSTRRRKPHPDTPRTSAELPAVSSAKLMSWTRGRPRH